MRNPENQVVKTAKYPRPSHGIFTSLLPKP